MNIVNLQPSKREELSSGDLLCRIFNLPENDYGQDGFDQFLIFARETLQTRIGWDDRKCVFVVEG